MLDEPLAETDQLSPVYKANGTDSEWIRMVNAPGAPYSISAAGAAVTEPDSPTDPTVAVTTGLTGLVIDPAVEAVSYGGSYEATLAVMDPDSYKLPETVSVKRVDNGEPWTDYLYDPETGELVIRHVTTELRIEAAAVPCKASTITLLLRHLNVSGVTSGDKINVGTRLSLSFTCDQGQYRLPKCIQVWQDGEALSPDAYTYDPEADPAAGAGSLVVDVKGDLTITASAIGTDQHELLLGLENIRTDLTGTGFADQSEVRFHLIPNRGYSLPQALGVKMGGNGLTPGVGYSYDATTGEFVLNAIQGDLEVSGTALPKTYPVTLRLNNLTSDFTEGGRATHGEALTVRLVAVKPFELPNAVTVAVDGVVLTTGYTYVNGCLTIDAVTGEVVISAKGQRNEEVTGGERTLSGDYTNLKVYANDELAKLTLDGLSVERLSVLGGSALLSVLSTSTVELLENQGSVDLTGVTEGVLALGAIDNQGTLVLNESLRLAAGEVTVTNDGTFYDYSGQIKVVSGEGALALTETLPINKTYVLGNACVLSVEVSVAAPEGDQGVVSFDWQRKVNGEWVSAPRLEAASYSSSYTVPQGEAGEFRCLVSRTYGDGAKTTLLCTSTIVYDSEPMPDPVPNPDPITPSIYKVTLPTLEGARIFALGPTEVSEGGDFMFKINLFEGYTTQNLQVKANGRELVADQAGWYTISDIQEDILVTITGIVKVVPDGVGSVEASETLVWTAQGQIHMHLTRAATVTVCDFTGRVVRSVKGDVGDLVIPVLSGQYLVRVGTEAFKVVL